MSLVRALAAVASRGSGNGFHLYSGDREIGQRAYSEVFTDAGKVAAGLVAHGVRTGDRVAVALPTSVDFARGFFGVLAAGAVAVPLPPPPRFAASRVWARRIGLIVRQSGIKIILADAALAAFFTGELAESAADAEIVGAGTAGFGITGAGTAGAEIVDIAGLPSLPPVYADLHEDDLALVQYTSGTVTSPKGVMLSHGNLLANVAAITGGLKVTSGDVACSWLPLFHDMGLIGMFLTAVLNDAEAYFLPPEHFARDPARWLSMISRHRATITAAPSFGYLRALRAVPASAAGDLDLSCWRLALNGAENAEAALMRRFSERFAPAGFRASAFLPVYGLAEAALAVTFPPLHREPRTVRVCRDALRDGRVELVGAGGPRVRELASVGHPVDGTEVLLRGDDRAPVLCEATVGEIHVRGASVTRGYEGFPETGTEDDGWVATGDLGFRHLGELFIVGRKKEMFIIRGQNYYAGDIESIASQVPGTLPHGVLAVAASPSSLPSLEGGAGEAFVVIVETSSRDPETRSALAERVRRAVSDGLGISPGEVLLVRRGRLPRTSSGKLRRGLSPSDISLENLRKG